MSPLHIVLISIVAVILVSVTISIYLARRCTAGAVPWAYLLIARVYISLMSSWRSNRPCNWPPEGPAIIVGNHTSPVDPLLLWYRHNREWPAHHARVVGFMVAREYVVQKNVIGWICRVMQSVPVNRSGQDTQAVRAALRRLASGELLGIFPEGHLNVTPEDGLQPFNTGIAYIALKSGAPIYPSFIHGAPRSTGMVACFFKRSRVRVTYGEPIDLQDRFGSVKKPTMETLEQATQHIWDELTRLGEERWWEAPT